VAVTGTGAGLIFLRTMETPFKGRPTASSPNPLSEDDETAADRVEESEDQEAEEGEAEGEL
jgi:hypothetical protein